jgi:cell division protein FtsN
MISEGRAGMLSRFAAPKDAMRIARNCVALAAIASLAACASQGPKLSAVQEAQQYQARAKHNYVPPGPPSDPWGPYIVEAAAKYDVPDRWIREVIRAESSGKVFDTSDPGAMGLMQVMPATYDELRAQYDLGDDAYDPHDNIMAGTAYLRQMYDLYGNPGFLAAYNAGPGRLDDYLNHHKALPLETRNYVAKIAPRIQGAEPLRPSPATQYAMNQIPINIPAGPRYPTRSQMPVALADTRRSGNARGSVQMASLDTPLPLPPAQSPQPQNLAAQTPQRRGGISLIPQAMADTMPRQSGGPSNWAVQVGAFGNEALARAAAESARAHVQMAAARTVIGTKKQGSGTLYRARLTGFSHEAALQACEKLSKSHGNCIVLSPDAQS